MKNQTRVESPLSETDCSALIVSEGTKRINAEVRAENGEAEQKLRRVCQSEQRSRTSVIAEYGDPRDWDHPCIVCGGEEPCSHDFDSISWPNIKTEGPAESGTSNPVNTHE